MSGDIALLLQQGLDGRRPSLRFLTCPLALTFSCRYHASLPIGSVPGYLASSDNISLGFAYVLALRYPLAISCYKLSAFQGCLGISFAIVLVHTYELRLCFSRDTIVSWNEPRPGYPLIPSSFSRGRTQDIFLYECCGAQCGPPYILCQ